MIRGWLVAARGGALLVATGRPAPPPASVTVEGNRFYRDGAPWVAEGVTLVGLVAPRVGSHDKPTYAAARAAFGPDMLAEVRRFGADLVRFQVSQAGLDPKSKSHDPATATRCSTRSRGPGGRAQRHRLDGVAGRLGQRDAGMPTGDDAARLARDRAGVRRRPRRPARALQRAARTATPPEDWATWQKRCSR